MTDEEQYKINKVFFDKEDLKLIRIDSYAKEHPDKFEELKAKYENQYKNQTVKPPSKPVLPPFCFSRANQPKKEK